MNLDTIYNLFANRGTGALPLTFDPRDWSALLHPRIAQALHAGAPATAQLGGTVGGIYDQGAEGACVAYSEAGVVSREETIQGRPWVWLDAEQFYRRNGGLGQNGIDTRTSLQDLIDHGINRRDGGVPIKEGSYLFVPKDPALWEPTIMAALSVGKAVTLATYLPTNFGWDSSGAPDPSRYHQVYIESGDDMWWGILNSWGPFFGQGGRGRLRKSFVDPTRGDVYAYIVAEAGVVPPPPPPPPPPLLRAATITGRAEGPNEQSLWPVAGQKLAIWPGVTLTPSSIVFDDKPNPNPDPTPGAVDVHIDRGRGYISAVVQDRATNAYLSATCHATAGARDFGQRQARVAGNSAFAAVWVVAGQPAGTVITVSAVTEGELTGSSTITL